jgi:hypothetical protein
LLLPFHWLFVFCVLVAMNIWSLHSSTSIEMKDLEPGKLPYYRLNRGAFQTISQPRHIATT